MSTGEDGLYLGLISGTSADAIDAVVLDGSARPRVIAARATPYPPALRARVLELNRATAAIDLDELGRLDVAIGQAFAEAARALLDHADVPRDRVRAIGSHGQTVRHRPWSDPPFTLQLGDPNVIAERTGITVVGDFRRRDVAAGGQGAPLVPAFHAAIFDESERPCVVLNLGGIGNVTVLADDRPVLGFDTGTANCLLDAWMAQSGAGGVDHGGERAARGRVDDAALARLLDDPYFRLPAPKSTGREHFHLDWLRPRLGDFARAPLEDVLATLAEFSAVTIADAVRHALPHARHVWACGGGVHNRDLMARIARRLGSIPLASTAERGIDPDYVEASAFAWLARETLARRPGNVATVTGARGPRILGAIYPA